MADFLGQVALAQDGEFMARVQQAAVAAAIALLNDPATDVRLANYCAALLNQPQQFARNLAFGVASNQAVTKGSGDSDLQWTVNSLMGAYAGVLPATKG
jgi:hypothetical protein